MQQLLLGLKRENKDNLELVQKEHDEALFKLRGEQATSVEYYVEKIQTLEEQLQKPTHISIPVGLQNRIKLFKKQLEVLGMDESPEVKAKYRKILFHWRRTLNDVMFSLYN